MVQSRVSETPREKTGALPLLPILYKPMDR